jgi:hypothetical protein
VAKHTKIKVMITNKHGNEREYLVKKNRSLNMYYLLDAYNDKVEWGCVGKTVDELFEMLEQDRKDGYCQKYEIIKPEED